MTEDQKNTVAEQRKTQALKLLANGFAQRLVDYADGDQRLCDTLMEIVTDFIDEEIPIVSDDDKYDLGFLLMERLILKPWTDNN